MPLVNLNITIYMTKKDTQSATLSHYERRLRYIRQAKQRGDCRLGLGEDPRYSAQEATIAVLWELLYERVSKSEAKHAEDSELYVLTGVIQRLASAHNNVSKSVDHPIEHEILGYKRDQLKTETVLDETQMSGIPIEVMDEIEQELGLF